MQYRTPGKGENLKHLQMFSSLVTHANRITFGNLVHFVHIATYIEVVKVNNNKAYTKSHYYDKNKCEDIL